MLVVSPSLEANPRIRALANINLDNYSDILFKWRGNTSYSQNNRRKLREQERRNIGTRSSVYGFSTSVSKKFIRTERKMQRSAFKVRGQMARWPSLRLAPLNQGTCSFLFGEQKKPTKEVHEFL